jgi:hypothetical protein
VANGGIMSHLYRESPDDEPETPEPPDDFVYDWMAENKDKIVDKFSDEIINDYAKFLDGKKIEAQESRADDLAQIRKDER